MTVKAPPPSGRASGRKFSLSDLQTGKTKLPPAILVHGCPGVGKTSLVAYAPKPIWMMSKLENGIIDLRNAGLVPEHVGNFPECKDWKDPFAQLDFLKNEEHDFQTLVIDTANGFEKMLHDHVCERDYNNKFAAFAAYQAGFKVAVNDWRLFLASIDELREKKEMRVVLIAHTKIKNFKNPEGSDFDRYIPDMTEEVWSVTHGWAGIILFLNFDVEAQKEYGQAKAKGKGGQERFIYTTRTAAWDAKNRHNLPAAISMGSSGQEAWTNLVAAMKGAS